MLHWKCAHLWRKAQRCEEISKGHDGQNIKDSLCRQLIPVVLVLMFEDTNKLSVILPRLSSSRILATSKLDLTSDRCV